MRPCGACTSAHHSEREGGRAIEPRLEFVDGDELAPAAANPTQLASDVIVEVVPGHSECGRSFVRTERETLDCSRAGGIRGKQRRR